MKQVCSLTRETSISAAWIRARQMSEHFWRTVMVLAVTLSAPHLRPPLAAAATWELLSQNSPESFQARNLEQFASDVEQATAGQLRIVVLADSARLDARQIKQAVAAGRAPGGELLLSDLRDEDAAFEVDSIPFLATDYYEALRLWDASRPVLGRMLEAQGVHPVFAVASPPRGLFATKNVSKMDDLRGLRLLDDDPFSRQFAILVEAVPTPVPGSMAQAFAAGQIDAAIASLPDEVAQQAWEVVENYYDLGMALPKSVVVFNRTAFASLDPEIQRAVLNAAVAAQNRGWQWSAMTHNAALDLVHAHGMSVVAPDPQLLADMRKIGSRMADQWERRSGSEAQRILRAYRSQR